MDLSGNIEDFSPVDIMQYIYVSGKTGILGFKKDRVNLFIFFKKGNIYRAAGPGMTNIGDILLKQGKINYENIKKAVQVQQSDPGKKLFGNILRERFSITQEDVREALIIQIKEVIQEVLRWEEGEFSLELKECSVPDDILVAFDEVVIAKHINTEFILLEAARLSDEKKGKGSFEKPNRKESGIESLTERKSSPGDTGSGDGIGEITKIKSNIAAIKEIYVERRERGEKFSISNSLLEIISTCWRRSVLFLNRDKELLALGALIREGDELRFIDEVKNIIIPLEPDSMLTHCIKNRSSFAGLLPEQPWLSNIHKVLGKPKTDEIFLIPVSGLDRDICLLYGDSPDGTITESQHITLDLATAMVGIILENHLLKKQMEGPLSRMYTKGGL